MTKLLAIILTLASRRLHFAVLLPLTFVLLPLTSLSQTVTTNICENGSACTWEYAIGSTVTLIAEPDDPRATYFAGWLTDLSECRTNHECTFTIRADKKYKVEAIFADYQQEKIHLYIFGQPGSRVTSAPAGVDCIIPVGATDATCEAAFIKGTRINLTAAPIPGGKFTWRISGCSGTGPCTVLMTKTKTGNVRFY